MSRGLSHRLWAAPRRTWLRSAIFQVHLWVGIGLALYVAISGLSGSALVFREDIDLATHPVLLARRAAGATVAADLDAVVREAARQNPGFTAIGLQDLERAGHAPAVVMEGEAGAARTAPERMVYFDLSTGRILATRDRFAGFLGWCANLHYYLLAGTRGYLVNGIFAAFFAVLCVSGWLLWWPGVHGILRALRFHWRARWPRLNWDLHTAGGFWANPALFLVVTTGVLFIFPAPVLSALAYLSGGRARDARAYLTPIASPTSSLPVISINRAYRAARGAVPYHAWIGYLGLSLNSGDSWSAIAYRDGAAAYSMPVTVYVDRSSASVLAVRDARTLPLGLRLATYSYAVHFGSFAGWASKVAWFLLGLTPTALLTTGFLMWWHRSLRRIWATRRRSD